MTPRPDRPLKSLLSALFPELSAACHLSLHSDTQTRLCPYAHQPAQAPSGPWSPRVPSRPSLPPRLTVPCPRHLRPPDAPPWAFSTPPLVPAAPLKVTRVHPLLPGLTLTLHPGDPAAGLPWPPHFSHPQPLCCPARRTDSSPPGVSPGMLLPPCSPPFSRVTRSPGALSTRQPRHTPEPPRPPKPTQGPSSPLPAPTSSSARRQTPPAHPSPSSAHPPPLPRPASPLDPQHRPQHLGAGGGPHLPGSEDTQTSLNWEGVEASFPRLRCHSPGQLLKGSPHWGPSPWCLRRPLTLATKDHTSCPGSVRSSSPSRPADSARACPPRLLHVASLPPPATTPTPSRVSQLLISTCNSWASSRAPQTQRSKQTLFPKSTLRDWPATSSVA